MLTRGIGILGLCGAAVAGCANELPSLPEDSRASLAFEPEATHDRVPPVVRLHVPAAGANPATLRLFRDPLSDYHLGRIRAGELPGTLLEREVPALAWSGAQGASLSSVQPLENGSYSLASPELGLVGTFTVRSDGAPPVYQRIFPPPGESGAFAAYCGEPAPLGAGEVTLAPSGAVATLTPGLSPARLFADRCLELEAEPAGPGVLLPPPAQHSVLLDPEPLWVVAAPAGAEAPGCAPGALSLGAGCVEVQDHRLLLTAPAPLLWLFLLPAPLLVVSEASTPHSVDGLVPSSAVLLEGETIDTFGRHSPFSVSVTTRSAAPRLVLNEVLANPAGPEPALEWIEIQNAGSAPASLVDHVLADSGGAVTLPEASLLPGQFALLVKEGYAPDPALDVPPAAGTLLIALSSLGKNGLANGGEALQLFDPSGALVSRVPALASKSAGVSLARTSPLAPDVESSFGLHAAPGASPGAPNVVAEP